MWSNAFSRQHQSALNGVSAGRLGAQEGSGGVESDARGIEVNDRTGPVGLVDIGGTKILVGVSSDGQSVDRFITEPTTLGRPVDQLTTMLDSVREGCPLALIAMSLPGPFTSSPAAFINPPNQPVNWHGLNFQDTLGRRYGCQVVAGNDANCAAIAEANFGAGKGFGSVYYYTVSTGIGSGYVLNGQLVPTRSDIEGGHQTLWPKEKGGRRCHCGGYGHLEGLASGLAIEAIYGKRAERLDDPDAWAEIGMWLGLAVANTTSLLDCDVVVFGGGLCASWNKFEASLKRTATAEIRLQPVPEIRLAELGPERNIIGALRLATSP